ncbi:hypothetical protein Smp_140320 [Schistosoma mansoni]|uniref:hypothetical protein n=1 Tax=Schistosoma mansoni TaxID=6183 RepID=UPI0001A63EC3|nr:hypothetical protein Smp_140320 [Schistosoma mansoni]|eukprot:XP_018645211.1 hypothetical protein Smp_140320 [Schistosoma mansoni]
MDELDSLLNELHQTNQKILQKNNALNSSSDCSSTLTHVTKTDKRIESDYNTVDSRQYQSGKAVIRNGDHSSSTQPESVNDLNKMLTGLDNFDYLHTDEIPQAYFGFKLTGKRN